MKFTTPDGSPPPSVHRRELRNAPYNPRTIQDVSRDKLKKNIKTKGLLEPLVWNKRTGHVVSGHQRIKILDALMRTDNYFIPVAVVDLSEKEEREQNVFFNNPDAQGEFEDKLLKDLIAQPDFDTECAGFDLSEVVERFGADALVEASEKLKALSAALESAKQRNEDIKAKSGKDNRADFYRVVVFETAEEAERLSHVNGEINCVFLHGRRLLEKLTGGR